MRTRAAVAREIGQLKIEQIESRSHVIDTARPSERLAKVSLGRLDTIPNKDFVLRYKVAGEKIKSGLVTCQDKRGGFFTLILTPGFLRIIIASSLNIKLFIY